MDRIVAWLVAIAFAITSFVFYQKAGQAKSEVTSQKDTIEKIMRTHVDAGLLQKARKLTFATIDDSFSTVAQDKGIGWRADIEFRWTYPYDFGFDIPENWNWNLKEEEPGVVSLEVPALQQLTRAPAAPKQSKVINAANGKHLTEIETQVNALADQMVKAREKYYLENPSIQETARLGMAGFVLDILNTNTPKDQRPIHKVIVKMRK